MLRFRLFFGTLFIVVLIGLIVADDRLGRSAFAQDAPAFARAVGLARLDGLITVVILAGLVILGNRELHRLFVKTGCAPLRTWPVLMSVTLVVIPFVAANGLSSDRAALLAADTSQTLTCFTIAVIGTCLLVMARRETDGAVAAIGATLLMVVYLGLLPQYIVRLRVFGPVGAAWLMLYFIFTVKVCDIGAYFTGRAAGRRKLIEWLSPKKTVEGLLGGVAASVVFAVGVPLLVGRLADPSSPVRELFPPLLRCASFGILMALVGQAGDLLESLIKRDAAAKDAGNAIPAFGGVLDILDSLLLTAPLACWILLE